MRKLLLIACIGTVFFVLDGALTAPSPFEGKIVKKIEFEGLRNIDPDDLLDIMITEEGYPLVSADLSKDVDAIFKKGNFENVRVAASEFQDGVRLRIICKVRPVVKEIVIKGNDEVHRTELAEIILQKEDEPLRIDLVEKSVRAMKEKYDKEGLFNAVITYRVERSEKDEERVNVVFVIDEGEEVKIAKIIIMGARRIPVDEIMGVLELKEDGFFSDGDFKRDEYEKDKGKILALYRERGYLDAQIIEDKVEYEWENPEKQEKRAIFVTIKLSEGDRYFFDRYTIAGNKVIESRVFEQQFEQTKSGAIFNDTLFQKDRQMISYSYSTMGYIFARVIPKRTVEERQIDDDGVMVARKYVRIDFEITEGTQAYIENIIIKGNKKTKDKVIRRELLMKEGELFNAEKMRISREKVYNLGYFKEVNFDVRPGSKEGYMNLIVDVEEQPSGTISLGGGYGTTSGFSIFADVAENNLMGNGQRIGARFEYGPQRTSITLSFREPWLFDYPLALNTSVFYSLYTVPGASIYGQNKPAQYEKQAIGYSVSLTYRFWYYYGIGSGWTHAFKSILNPTGNSSDEIFIEQSYGDQEKRTLAFFVIRNSIDNYLNPTRGWKIELDVAFTGGTVLYGHDHFIKYSPDLYVYFSPFNLPFLKTHPCVIELRANAAFLTPPMNTDALERYQPQWRNRWLESEDRLYMGGPETLRGWDYYDDMFPKSWRWGLFHRILYGLEFRIPIHPQMLWFVAFFDAGSLWTDEFWEANMDSYAKTDIDADLDAEKLYRIDQLTKVDVMWYSKYSWGLGFKIQIPVMPLRFWFGRRMMWVQDNKQTFKGYFKEVSDFQFQFAIGDMRF